MLKVDGGNYYRVIKCESNLFAVDAGGEIKLCNARKKIKKSGEIMVGDFVSIEESEGAAVLENVLARKNCLVRPYVANIDQIIIVAAPVPQIDYFLIDKLIINAHKQKLDIVLCLNKNDISASELEKLKAQYSKSVQDIVCISAKNGEMQELYKILKGRLSCFAGQSAVGKSTITNALLKNEKQAVGDLSVKSMRGKNTTTSAEIIVLDNDTYIIDTPGFTMLDIFDIDYRELDLYYPEYVEIAADCRYHRCTHTSEPECFVRESVEAGGLSKERYERYKIMFNELKAVKKY